MEDILKKNGDEDENVPLDYECEADLKGKNLDDLFPNDISVSLISIPDENSDKVIKNL